jgi:cell fate (sporulation/competence/biofilm development) regulator YlbF (YheA/YmcA/DUF963 family)
MSLDPDTASEDQESIESLAETLGEAINELPEYQQFQERQATVREDDEAQDLIAEFEEIREEYMQARQRGEATNQDLRRLQEAQEELHDLPVMSDFLQAQNALELRLQALNEHVSEPLEIDFAEKAGGCCND